MYRKNISIYIEILIFQLKNLKTEKIIINLKRTFERNLKRRREINFSSIGKISLRDI